MERNNRPTRQGTVVSAGKMDKTVVVAIVDNVKHPLYKKVVKRKLNLKLMMRKMNVDLAT